MKYSAKKYSTYSIVQLGVTVRLHVTCAGLGTTHTVYRLLATSHRSLIIFISQLPLIALQYCHRPLQLYVLIYLGMRPDTGIWFHTIIARKISNTFSIRDFIDYPIVTHHDTQSTHNIWARFGLPDRISRVSRYANRLRLNVTEMIWCRFHRTMSQRHVTILIKKLSPIDSARVQKQLG